MNSALADRIASTLTTDRWSRLPDILAAAPFGRHMAGIVHQRLIGMRAAGQVEQRRNTDPNGCLTVEWRLTPRPPVVEARDFVDERWGR